MNIDPNLRSDIDDGRPKVENLQEKYDSLKVKFEGLMNRQRRGRKSANPKASSSKKPETMMEAESAEMEPQEVPSFPVIDEKDARRKRLMGLEVSRILEWVRGLRAHGRRFSTLSTRWPTVDSA